MDCTALTVVEQPALPSELTATLELAADFARASKAKATQEAYGSDFRFFESWCRSRGLSALPATAESLCAFLADQATLGKRSRACERDARTGAEHRVAAPQLGKRRRHIMHCDDPEGVSLTQIHRAGLGRADAGRVLQHGLEHGLQLAGRARYEAQHLRRRALLLERLGELLFQVGVGCAKTVNVSSRLRCLRTKTGVSSGLCPFSSQDHPLGAVTGSPSGRPSQGSSLSILTEPHDELARVSKSCDSKGLRCLGALKAHIGSISTFRPVS